MSTLPVGHRFTVNQVAGVTNSVDAFLNIQKRREEIVYRSATVPANVNLAFVRGLTISSDDNIGINDRSFGLLENREVEQLQARIFNNVSSFTSNAERILVTDVFTTVTGSQVATPLFYAHSLAGALPVGGYYRNVQILNSFFDKISPSQLKIDLALGKVYNNLSNSFSLKTGLFEVFHIDYEVVSSLGAVTKYREILDNVNVFRPATFDDLDGSNALSTTAKAYLIEETGTLFNVILPIPGKYAAKNEPGARLSVVHPTTTGPDDPWFVSITNGKFLCGIDTGGSSPTVFKYYIPEFLNQSFVPVPPFKLISKETSYRVQSRIIKTIKDTIVNDPSESLYAQVYVYREDGSLKFAMTNDPLLLNTPSTVTGKNFAPVGFESIDRKNGFIVLPTGYEITQRDTIESSYYYTENRYEYNLFDLNPLSNVDLLKQTLVLFIKPEAGSTITESLFYLLVDENGVIEDSNFLDFTVIGMDYSDFVNDHTVQGTPNSDALLILAEVFVRESSSPETLAILDIRVRGGGIKESRLEEAKDLAPEVCWSMDVAPLDGTPYPGAASYFIEIPYTVLAEFGGRFEKEQVRGIVQRHTAAGVYPVIWKYGDYEPVILNVEYIPGGIIIEWSQGPSDALFDIYTALSPAGPWTLVAEDIVNDPDGNIHTVVSASDVCVVVAGRAPSTEAAFGSPLNV